VKVGSAFTEPIVVIDRYGGCCEKTAELFVNDMRLIAVAEALWKRNLVWKRKV